MRLAYAATAATLALLLAGCTGGGDEPGDAMSTWTPSGTVETPSLSPTADETPIEPPLPDAATKPTEAGARAFITYYWDLINYAQATGDLRTVKRVSGPRCRGCKGAFERVNELYASGGRLTGGEYENVTLVKVNQLGSDDPANYAFEAKVTASNSAGTAIHGDGSTEDYPRGDSTVNVAVIWLGDTWRLDAFEAA